MVKSLYFVVHNIQHYFFKTKLVFGPMQEDEGPFWRVRCNRNLKNQASLYLLGFFETLMQNILH